jgi:hypothetical protein
LKIKFIRPLIYQNKTNNTDPYFHIKNEKSKIINSFKVSVLLAYNNESEPHHQNMFKIHTSHKLLNINLFEPKNEKNICKKGIVSYMYFHLDPNLTILFSFWKTEVYLSLLKGMFIFKKKRYIVLIKKRLKFRNGYGIYSVV